MRILDVDFDRWVALMLPTFMRRERLYALCRAMCSPVERLHGEFATVRKKHLHRAKHNGQVCYLRSALDEAFGRSAGQTGFDIEDADSYEGVWQYAKDEGADVQLYAVDEALNNDLDEDAPLPEHPIPLLADEARLAMEANQFIVRVPAEIYDTRLEEVKAIVEQFRILTKQPKYTSISN